MQIQQNQNAQNLWGINGERRKKKYMSMTLQKAETHKK